MLNGTDRKPKNVILWILDYYLPFIFYQARCSYIDVYVSYAKLKPYLDSSVYNILAGGTGWSK